MKWSSCQWLSQTIFTLLFGSQPDQSFPVGSRIDEDTGPFDIEGIAVGITSPVFAGEKADRSEYLLFHGITDKTDKGCEIRT